MSDIMLHGVLNMPPNFWTGDALDVAQRHGRYKEASARIAQLERENGRLREALKSLLNEIDGDAFEEIGDARAEYLYEHAATARAALEKGQP